MNSWLIFLILLSPLVGGLIGYLFKGYCAIIGSLTSLVSFVTAIIYLITLEGSAILSWIWLPGFELSIRIDQVSLLLISLVSLVSFLVQVFSSEYMREDKGIRRFYAKLGFFISSMIGLLLADNLILLFVFWELVGLASYLLIGFWYAKEGIPKSARTAFMVNRIADAALLAGIILVYNEVEDLSISSINEGLSFLTSILIAFGAFGKSAQFPFSGWLVKAMVGPTPVSALIHAATMVAAGVYLLFRTASFLHSDALLIITVVGVLTAFYAAICAIVQFDLKKVLAYSTISQLGYMILGIGVGSKAASLFHLYTHAFFKAGLFLGAASIIHYLHKASKRDPQDMRFMGGLRKHLPWTYWSFLLCGLALAGIPFFSGFMSKDGILLGAWAFAEEYGTWAYLIPNLALITTALTSFYVGRMILLVFLGQERNTSTITYIEGRQIFIPLIVLSVFSIWIFHDWNPLAHNSLIFELVNIPGSHFDGGELIPFLSIFLVATGMILAYSFFKPGTGYSSSFSELREPNSKNSITLFNGLGLTLLYDQVGIWCLYISKKLVFLDQKIIDTFIHFSAISSVVFSKVLALVDRFMVDGPINLSASLIAFTGKRLSRLSSRDGQTQLAWLLVSVILILLWIIVF